MLTVEALLANSLWVMLTPEKQFELLHDLERIPRPLIGTFTPTCISSLKNEDWECYYRKVGDSGLNWWWDTFPHPSSWPKEHVPNPPFLKLSYDEERRNYELEYVYMRRFDKERRSWYYTRVDRWELLVYSDLTLNFGAKASEASKDQTYSLLRIEAQNIERLRELIEGNPRFNAISRKANGLLIEINRRIEKAPTER